jgi:hypothetical protein
MCTTLRQLADAAYRYKLFTVWGHLTDAAKLLEPCVFCEMSPCRCDDARQEEKDEP